MLEVVGALADPLDDQVEVLVVDDFLEGIHALDGLLLLPQLQGLQLLQEVVIPVDRGLVAVAVEAVLELLLPARL